MPERPRDVLTDAVFGLSRGAMLRRISSTRFASCLLLMLGALCGEFQLRGNDDKAFAAAPELNLDHNVNASAVNREASSPATAESTPAFFLAHEATAGTLEPLVIADNQGENQESVPLRSFFGEGFGLESLDRQIQLRIRALNQVDGKIFSPTDQQPARSGLYIPRFRIYLEGQLTSLVEYELSLQRSVEGAFDVLDANVNFVTSEALQIRIGRALVPYSYSWYDHLEQYYVTPERGLFPLNFGLARQAGIFAHGKLVDEQVQYAVGTTFGQLSGLADTNNTRDAVGYVNVRPFLQSEQVPRFRFLNLGGSLSIGRQVDPAAPLPIRTSIQTSENDEAAQAASSIFLRFSDAVVAKGQRLQGALHLACYSGPISFEAEWFAARFGMASEVAAPAIGVPISGHDITVASFLTGETIDDRTTVDPLRPVTRGQSGIGAFELFARYSKLQLGQQIYAAGLVDQADWTNSAAITDIGINWYLNRFTRCTFDWQHSLYATPVLLNAAENLRSRHNDLYWFRCQFYF